MYRQYTIYIGLLLTTACLSCKSSRVSPYPEARNYDDTTDRVRVEERKMKKPVFDTSIQYYTPPKK